MGLGDVARSKDHFVFQVTENAAIGSISDKEACSATLMKTFVSLCKAGAPLVELLCDSLEQPY